MWTDQHIWLPGVSVSVVHLCRSLLLSFSTYYLGILGLEGAINCILARTSHQRTTSEKRTKALLPLFGGSTVNVLTVAVDSAVHCMLGILHFSTVRAGDSDKERPGYKCPKPSTHITGLRVQVRDHGDLPPETVDLTLHIQIGCIAE